MIAQGTWLFATMALFVFIGLNGAGYWEGGLLGANAGLSLLAVLKRWKAMREIKQ